MNKKILEKAQNTMYKHRIWFLEGDKTVYEAIKYYVTSGDFYLCNTIKYLEDIPEYKGEATKQKITQWLIEKEMYNKLVIRYAGRRGGTDKGKLKVQTFLALQKEKQLIKD